jgi:hypothetical protein
MVQPIANDGLLYHGRATVLQLSAFIIAAASLCIASPVSSQPFGSGNVSFVNVDKVEIDLLVTDNVNNQKKTFHLGVGKESSTFKVSGDAKDGGNSNLTWKATGQDAGGKKAARCGTEKQPIRGGKAGSSTVFFVQA